MYKTILKGFAIGIILSLLIWFLGKHLQGTPVLEFLIVISTPVAWLIAKITGWPLGHESGMMMMILSIIITPPLYGLIIGSVLGFIKKR